MKVGLFSITYLGIWYDGPVLTPIEVVRQAHALGYDGIDLAGKRPHGHPLDLDADGRRELRDVCGELGIDIAAVGAYNDFSSPITEHRECQLLMVRELIRLARDIGAPVVRVFLASPGVTMREGIATYDIARQRMAAQASSTPWLESWWYARECLREMVRYAEDDGVVLALQNHQPLLRHHQDMLDMIAEVDSPWLKACLDCPLLDRQDDAFVQQVVRQTGTLQVHSHFGGEFERDATGSVRQRAIEYGRALGNYPAFVRALNEIGYDGYLSYEFCHPALTRRREPAGIDYIHEQAKLALAYMRQVFAEAGVASPDRTRVEVSAAGG